MNLLLVTMLLVSPACAVERSTAAVVVAVDPGHGGRDFGVTFRGRMEKEATLALSRRLAEELRALPGLRPLLLREGDEYIGLVERVDKARAAGARALLSLHVDDRRLGSHQAGRGIVVYFYGRSHERLLRRLLLPAPPQAQVEASRRLAVLLARSLREGGFPAAEVDRGQYVIVKGEDVPSVLVEFGNFRDPEEARRLSDPAFQKRLARALARGLEAFLER
ncbi:MAG: N-acetylmuramoyl-L-alanine amidase [Elusimicrobiota bacterium]|jgi:N-acetylmuramoyl-L-alanine amidase